MGSPPPGTQKIQNRSLYIGTPPPGTTLATFKKDFLEFRRRMEALRKEFMLSRSIDCQFVSGPWVDPARFDGVASKKRSRRKSRRATKARSRGRRSR